MRIFNRRATFNNELFDRYEAGIELTGLEAKALRKGDADLSHSYAKIIGNQLFLINAGISVYGSQKTDPRRSRRLLLHRKEIDNIEVKIKQKKLTLVPISLYNKGRLFKVELALARTKRSYQKKETIKRRDIERDIERALRGDKQ